MPANVQTIEAPLTRDQLMKILTEPKNAILKQYQKFFELENARLTLRTDAMEAIAEIALKKKTGARGLRAIIENLLLDVMFELPSRNDPRDYVITDENVRGERPVTAKARRPVKEEPGEELRETA